MSLLGDILEHNTRFVTEREKPITKAPAKGIAIFTCMDTRLVDFLEPAMGIRRGDAKVIKNAGNTIIDPLGGVMRSLVVAIFALGCEEIFVVGHSDCGMSQINEEDLKAKMLAQGIDHGVLSSLNPGFKDWLGAFHDPWGNVQRVVAEIRRSPLIPKDVPVHGLMFDPVHGCLELLSNGYAVFMGNG